MNRRAEIRPGQVPSREQCVLRYVLEQRASETPDQPYICLGDGSSISFGDLKQQVEQIAAGLRKLGVEQGHTVNVWMPSGIEMLRHWFAINWLGAVFVPINVSYRGNLLAHVIKNAEAKIMIASSDLIERLLDIDCAKLETIVVAGDRDRAIPGFRCVDIQTLQSSGNEAVELLRPIEPWDLQSVIYTSGTTGRSKGVASSYGHFWHMGGKDSYPMLTENDCFLVTGPMFHVMGTLPPVIALNLGGRVGLAGEFSTDTFWTSVKRTGATYAMLLGVMSSFLMKRPASEEDREHTLKNVTLIPLPEDYQAFGERFGSTVWALYNMSETNVPLVSGPNPVPGSCGKRRSGNELRIVDQNDCELPVGEIGELIIRSDSPWALNSGYFKDYAATAIAWRNGWFHTGDAFRVDEDGNYFFADRLKDAIRRRGENISSFEVEAEILAHPLVRECAVVAAANEMSEDDVLAVVATVPGSALEPAELFEFLRPRLAYFMLPRYIRVMNDLPKTPTQKVEKYVLRNQGVTVDTWDREKVGIKVRRETLKS